MEEEEDDNQIQGCEDVGQGETEERRKASTNKFWKLISCYKPNL